MIRCKWFALAVLLSTGLIAGHDVRADDAKPPTVKAVVESPSVKDAGLSASVVTNPTWLLPAAGKSTPVEIQVRLTDAGTTDLVVSPTDALSFYMIGPDGKTLATTYGRLRSAFVRSLWIHPGQSFTVCFKASLVGDAENKYGLRFEDQSGGMSYTSPLGPGTYKVGFTIASKEMPARELMAYPPNAQPWYGTMRTAPLSVDIVPSPTVEIGAN